LGPAIHRAPEDLRVSDEGQRDAIEDLCVGALEQIDTVVVADNLGGLWEEQHADGNQDSGERTPAVLPDGASTSTAERK
jgi:hypothetical protein